MIDYGNGRVSVPKRVKPEDWLCEHYDVVKNVSSRSSKVRSCG